MNHRIFYQGICIIAALFLTIDASSQWPQWRGPERNGISSEQGLLTKWPSAGPLLAWSVNTVGDGFSSTIVQDQLVFTQGKKDSVEILSALDLNGKLIWQKTIGRALVTGDWQQSRCTPAYYKSKVYALSSIGDLACFDARTGKREWQMKAFEKFGGDFGPFAESPLVVDDKVIITPCGYQTTMVALDRLTGKTVWRTESLRDSNLFASPLLIKAKDKKYIFQSSKLYDFIIDPGTGKIIWKDNRVASGYVPQVISNKVYFTGSGTGGVLFSWNEELSKRTVIWSDSIRAMEIGGSAVIGDKIIVSSLPRGICSIDLKTGKTVARNLSLRTCNFLVAGNQLYCYEDGTAKVYLFNVTDKGFDLAGSLSTSEGTGPAIAHMALSNGLLFLRRGNVLMAYKVKA